MVSLYWDEEKKDGHPLMWWIKKGKCVWDHKSNLNNCTSVYKFKKKKL